MNALFNGENVINNSSCSNTEFCFENTAMT